ncbi:aspartate kinase [Candidatus Nitrosopelagicus sp.]|nr:aspartate kinase [Candidatus Nitrosopelagicus sp.]|tara:strand:- start:215 stop:1630 length:1416 start_codon:yes stop_codon:yes gene_type:complete
MNKLTIAKFGGSAIGIDGEGIPDIVKRIKEIQKDSKIIVVCSAPLTMVDGKKKSLTDVILGIGHNAVNGDNFDFSIVEKPYLKLLEYIVDSDKDLCKKIIDEFLKKSKDSIDEASSKKEFLDETRSKALAFSGEVLMSHVLNLILNSNEIISGTISLEDWPIITDNNIESTNFLFSESVSRMGKLEEVLEVNDVVTIGGFIGKTKDGIITTYERGGSDRTAADLGILFHKKYDTIIDLEKDSSVVSADPKIVKDDLEQVNELSYNEARLAGMFGMKIVDPIAIKEILENGLEIPLTITNMKSPEMITKIQRNPEDKSGHPLKIVTGKKNCAILRIESEMIRDLLVSLDKDKRYSEFIVLSPFTKDGIEFSRVLFLDGDYVKRNEKYILSFDALATVAYERGVVTLIGDEMWRVQQIASKASSKIGDAGLNILNMDAQEETSRIIIVIEDVGDSVEKAIEAIHSERSKIKFI